MNNEEFTEQDWRRFLASIGEDPDRPGLLETPHRVAKAWKHWTSGYEQNPVDLLKAFEDGAEQYNELIVVKNIPVYSQWLYTGMFFTTISSLYCSAPSSKAFNKSTGFCS